MFVAQGQLALAVKHYEQVLRARPDVAQVHYNLGLIRQAEGKPLRALEHLRRAVAIEPKHVMAHFYLGRVRRVFFRSF